MPQALGDYARESRALIEEALFLRLPVSHLPGAARLNEALCYAMFPGGKRMRPLLTLLSAGVCGASSPVVALAPAVAVEFLHASSLIFDDLPAMDDAATRRSQPSVHRAFGEGTAVLAGLALFNEAWAIFAETPSLASVAAHEIGARGMIGGQAADLAGDDSQSRLEKTTALLRLTMAAGAASASARPDDTQAVISFGETLGEIYQTCDDMVDAFAAVPACGKTIGQDQRHHRCNIASNLGYDRACVRVRDLAHSALHRLRRHFGQSPHIDLLEEFARGVVARGVNGEL